jgi:exonuclease SbcC
MNIERITLQNFTTHDRLSVTLPRTGIVLVTGPNGSGKSSLIEAVATAYWGKTLRGTTPWRPDDAGRVEVTSDVVCATRTRKGARGGLEWHRTGEAPVEWETTTKAQDGLEAVVGPLEVWRRTSVLSSADAATFTLAADADRKRLLETLLGLERFDGAHEAARAAHRKAEAALAAAETAVAREQGRVQAAEAALTRAQGIAPPEAVPDPPADADDQMRRLRRQADEAAAEARSILAGARGDGERVGAARAAAEQATTRAHRLSVGTCPTCAQVIPPALVERLAGEANTLTTRAVEAERAARAAAAAAQTQADELADESAQLQRRVNDLRQTVTRATDARGHAQRVSAAVREAEVALTTARAAYEAAQAPVEALRREVAELLASVQVLGTRGVRAHVLGSALAGVEAAANEWLHRICGERLRLSLSASTERKSGAVADAIALEVVGAGGGFGYRAASGGERRRIDVALLLGLAEVAQAAHGRTGGTLWLDEAFDALDSEGAAAVCGALAELAESRCVVVVTHSPDVIQNLRPALRVRMGE